MQENGKENEPGTQFSLTLDSPSANSSTNQHSKINSSKPKYDWQIGLPLPFIDRHSQVKHTILREYIREYVARVMSNPLIPKLSLSIVDGFSGGGAYRSESGKDVNGSPLMMMEAVREARFTANVGRKVPREVDVSYFFVDAKKPHIDHLKHWVDAEREKNLVDDSDYRNIEYFSKPFFEAFPAISKRIKDKKGGERVIFILDQYSYKDVPLAQVRQLLSNFKNSEVIMTFNIDNLLTYLSERAENRKAVANIDLDQYIPWDQLKEIKETKQWRKVIQKYVADGIKKETAAEFMTPFFVKPEGNSSWSYWLIHLSNHYRAHDVMKDLHWEHATDFGHELSAGHFVLGYDTKNDFDHIPQNSLCFDESSKEICVDELRERFAKVLFSIDKPVSVRSLLASHISNSMASERFMFQSVSQLHNQNDVTIWTKDDCNRRPSQTYNDTDVIQSKKQISVFAK